MGSNGRDASAGYVPAILKNAGQPGEPWSVEAVVAKLPGGPPTTNSESPVPFFHMIERLKTTKREGWRRFGLETGESIADHMYRMSLITMCAPASLVAKLDIQKCTKMALIHDVAEALVGDITPVDGVPKSEKSRRESTTMDYLTGGLLGGVNGGKIGKDFKDIWQEYEDGVTPESKFVHDVDKIELVLQMVEYERQEKGQVDLSEFRRVATRIEMPEVQAWADEILEERKQFWKEHGKDIEAAPAPEKELATKQDEYYGKA